MVLFSIALAVGIVALVLAANLFVDGAAATARHFGLSPLLIGMLIVGFGTSVPEMLVSALSALDGASGIALGNAWGSNITNIALILGVSAIVRPLAVHSRVLRTELPILLVATLATGVLILNLGIGRFDAAALLAAFLTFVLWSVLSQRRTVGDPLATEVAETANATRPRPIGRSVLYLVLGLALLILASRAIVWGAVGLARAAGVSDLMIGLTVVAVGTSLPELASSVAAARRGEDEIAFGNVIGSNLFNTLAVVGIAGAIRPIHVDRLAAVRDYPTMLFFTVMLFVVGFARRRRIGRVTRPEGMVLCTLYVAYIVLLVGSG
ncbi:MAG: calcium/sodium antiporter [Spirochaetes bacterium]|nr:calcium/sodium antiporter [Spirochaetota bacterium]